MNNLRSKRLRNDSVDKSIDENCKKCKVEKFVRCNDECGELRIIIANQADSPTSVDVERQKGADDLGADETSGNKSPMHLAVENGCSHSVRLLIDAGHDVNERIAFFNPDTYSPILHLAVRLNKPMVVQQLLHSGAQVNLRDSKSYTALHLATENGFVNIARLLLIHGSKISDVNYKGDTPLMIAAQLGFIDVLHLLMKFGANINQRHPRSGKRLLHVAAEKGDTDFFQIIIDYGAEIDATDKYGYTPLYAAIVASCKNKNNQCCNEESRSAVNIESCSNFKHVNMVIKLLKHGANTNVRDMCKETPFFKAIYMSGCNHLIQILLKNGAKLDFTEKKKRMLLNLAITKKRCEHLIPVLLDLGVDVNLRNHFGITPFFNAVQVVCDNENNQKCRRIRRSQLNNENVVKFCPNINDIKKVIELFKYGANLNLRSTNEQTPFELAIFSNSCEHLIQLLLDEGADVNKRDLRGNTPLHNAIKAISELSIKDSWNYFFTRFPSKIDPIMTVVKLMKHGANVNAVNFNGQTVLQKAISGCVCLSLIKTLLDNGAKVNVTDINKRTVLYNIVEKIAKNSNNDKCLNQSLKIKRNIKSCPNKVGVNTVIEFLKRGAKFDLNKTSVSTALPKGVVTDCCKHVIKAFIDNGADVNALDKYGNSALHNAITGQIWVFHVFRKKRDNDRVVSLCRNMENINTVIELLRYGADVNGKNRNGDTPIHAAIKSNRCKHLIQILCDHGADIDSTNFNNETVLETAVALLVFPKIITNLLLFYGSNYERLLDPHFSYLNKEELIAMIARLRIAKQMAGLPKNACDRILITSADEVEICEFRENCIKELQKMKSKPLMNNVTLFQFLRADKKFLAHFVSKERDRALLDMMPDIELQYPIYGLMIRKNWGIGRRYAPLFKKAVNLFGNALNDRLPLEPLQVIVSQLDYDEMKMLIKSIYGVKSLKIKKN